MIDEKKLIEFIEHVFEGKHEERCLSVVHVVNMINDQPKVDFEQTEIEIAQREVQLRILEKMLMYLDFIKTTDDYYDVMICLESLNKLFDCAKKFGFTEIVNNVHFSESEK